MEEMIQTIFQNIYNKNRDKTKLAAIELIEILQKIKEGGIV